ncbi:MAG: PD-(D/E)XK nuclease family protein [Bacteroidales bacterium]|nr:PD-(D/E)XK nuclease family protein [Bacteroidales bacterium]
MMISFLQQTAEDLYAKYGDDLTSIAVVFPNNRARLFFSEHLYKAAGKPVWTPGFVTISDLFRNQSRLKIADPLALVGYLYEVYIRESGKEESFDEFYLWGEILLSDFDDVDKNLADARQLFRNIREQAAYTDTLEHLSEDQVASIRLFFKNFDPDRKTELKQRFIENWNILYEVYQGFQSTLEEKGLAYEGMLYRRVIENLKEAGPSGFRFDKYAFVGFNVLNGCEIALFSLLHKAGKALFYWDYDAFYLNHPRHEAGRFMRQNLEKYPNELDKTDFDLFEKSDKNIRFISASTENAQARFLPEWINSLKEKGTFRPEETAVVLCNEGLLLSVLHSVPDSIQELNVTMGFPMAQTPVFNLINEITILHADGYLKGTTGRYNHRYVLPILQHPLIRQISDQAENLEKGLRSKNSFRPSVEELLRDPVLKNIFTPVEAPKDLAQCLLELCKQLAQSNQAPEDEDSGEPQMATGEYDPLHAEAIFRCYSLTNKIYNLLREGVIEVNIHTFQKLLQKVLSTASIPFSGEPVRGMQIMGMLETRNLDFKNVLLLSVNEGMLPKGGGETSFIPFNLRKGFGLTTPEHKDSIFAYYFFRLLQRAENISLVYNTSTDGLNRGEMSRFMLQLLVESKHQIEHINLNSGIELSSPRPIQIEKTAGIIQSLKEKYDQQTSKNAKKFSPTALNSLLDCSLRFYFRYIAGLKEADEVTEEIDGATMGNFFHHSAEYIYTSILLKKAGKDHSIRAVQTTIDQALINQWLLTGEISGKIEKTDLEPWLKGICQIDQVVDHFFRRDFFQTDKEDSPLEYNGEQLIKRKLVIGFIKTLLKMDQERAPFDMAALEKDVSEDFETETPAGNVTLRIGGIIDRIDQKYGEIRVLDYKTGGIPKTPDSVESLFESSADRSNYIFQIFLYSIILQKKNPSVKIAPEILYIHKAAREDYSATISMGSYKLKKNVDDISEYEEPFREKLNGLLVQLFDSTYPFTQTEVTEKCNYCDYKRICRR